MNILLLSPWLPWPLFDGARIRIFATLRFLARHHRVVLLSHIRHADEARDAAPLQELCERIETVMLSERPGAVLQRLAQGLLRGVPLIHSFHYHPQLAQRISTITASEPYDIIQVEFPFLSRYVRAISPHCRAKTILSTHNIETIRFQRELHISPWNGRRVVLLGDRCCFPAWEEQSMRQFDGIIATSHLDHAWIQQHVPTATVETVSNGVDVDYFQPVPASHQAASLVFIGLMNYQPNIDAVLWFCEAFLPILRSKVPHLRFSIVGSKPHPNVRELGKRPGVCVTGEVPDIRPYIADASVVVVPLRAGGGTRLKILQAMAMGRPVVSTTVGAEGLEITPGRDILIADHPEHFVQHVLSLLQAPAMAARLGKAGRRLVMEKYDWRVALRGIERLYDTVLESPRS